MFMCLSLGGSIPKPLVVFLLPESSYQGYTAHGSQTPCAQGYAQSLISAKCKKQTISMSLQSCTSSHLVMTEDGLSVLLQQLIARSQVTIGTGLLLPTVQYHIHVDSITGTCIGKSKASTLEHNMIKHDKQCSYRLSSLNHIYYGWKYSQVSIVFHDVQVLLKVGHSSV